MNLTTDQVWASIMSMNNYQIWAGGLRIWLLTNYEHREEYEYLPSMSRTIVNMTADQEWAGRIWVWQLTKDEHWAGRLWIWLLTKYELREWVWLFTKNVQDECGYDNLPSMSRTIMNLTTDQVWASRMSMISDYLPSMSRAIMNMTTDQEWASRMRMTTYQVWAGGLWIWLLTKYVHRVWVWRLTKYERDKY